MKKQNTAMIHAMEFGCEAPLKFYEHCSVCPYSMEECPDLELGIEILRGKKELVYNGTPYSDEGKVDVGEFNCSSPRSYFEKTRKVCAHKGRCREEGLLLALLTGKKDLTYSQKDVIYFPKLNVQVQEEEKGEKAVSL